MKRSTLWLATALLLSSCGGGAETPSTGDPGAGGPASSSNGTAAEALRFAFHDVTEAAGLAGFEQVNGTAEKLMIVETVGGGVALFDADLDGDLDAYLTNGGMLEGLEPGEEPRDAFYLNDGTGTFTDATERAGLGDELWTNGVIVADVNGDDWLDLYLTNYGPNRLYLNRGDGTFEDVTERAGVGDDRWSTGASFFDFDKDGDLDLYVANYIVFDEEVMLTERPLGTLQPSMQGGEDEVYTEQAVMFGPQGMPPERDAFFVNNGDGTFTNRSEELGVGVESENYGFQTLAFDADGDGWVDVYVANDLNENLLWHNDEGQGFSNQALELGLAVSLGGMPQGGMGACVGDFDNDLVADVYVTNFVEDYSTLYRGHKSGTFRDSTSRMRLNNVTWSLSGWGCEFADFDSDGGLELLACHGHVYPQVDLLNLGTSYLQRNLLFTLTDGALVEPPGSGGPGLEPKEASRGLAIGDVDGDGELVDGAGLEARRVVLRVVEGLLDGEAIDEGWNFGPLEVEPYTVQQMTERFLELWGHDGWQRSEELQAPHESPRLQLDCTKAVERLGWRPKWDVPAAIEATVQWYRADHRAEAMRDFTDRQIAGYREA